MKRRVLEILACPLDKYHPLDLYEFLADNETIREGVLVCPKCSRFFPVMDEIPIMLPDGMRKEKEEKEFLQKWKQKIPEAVLKSAKPFHI